MNYLDDCYDCEDDDYYDYEDDDYYDYEDIDREDMLKFAQPGGNSALMAASKSNPRNLPCPTCGAKNVLTPADRSRGYQCDSCADQAERGY